MRDRQAIEDLIYQTALRLDAHDFDGFLALCEPAFRYRISAFSPELRREMIWLEHDLAEMKTLFATLARHHSDKAPLTRHLTVYAVTAVAAQPTDNAAADSTPTATAVSAMQVFRTTLDGGVTELFAVGRIHDTVSTSPAGPRLQQRHIKLQTRMLGIGTHIPF